MFCSIKVVYYSKKKKKTWLKWTQSINALQIFGKQLETIEGYSDIQSLFQELFLQQCVDAVIIDFSTLRIYRIFTLVGILVRFILETDELFVWLFIFRRFI